MITDTQHEAWVTWMHEQINTYRESKMLREELAIMHFQDGVQDGLQMALEALANVVAGREPGEGEAG